jgi:hypothetical protein
MFNATVCIKRSRDAKRQDRGADNYLLPPLFCGSAATGYANTSRWLGGGMSLSDVMGICTAAVEKSHE